MKSISKFPFLYHVSKKNLGRKVTFEPRVPKNNLTSDGTEDNEIPRICLAPTIQGCILALDPLYKLKDLDLFVYQVIDKGQRRLSTKSIIKYDLVPDASKTKEVWFLESCQLNMVGQLHTDSFFGNFITFTSEDFSFLEDLQCHLELDDKKFAAFIKLIKIYESCKNKEIENRIQEIVLKYFGFGLWPN